MASKLLMAGLLLAVSHPVFAGSISLISTPYPDSIVVEVTVNDTGGALECGWLAITRYTGLSGSYGDVSYIERQAGATTTHRFVDTNVEPSTLYCYGMALRIGPFYFPCPTSDLCYLFECFYQIQTCANTGPDPAFIARGFLRSEWSDGTPVDHNETQALLFECEGSEFNPIGLHALTGNTSQYVDSGTPVDVFGTYVCCWAQGVWLLMAQAAAPQSCVLPVHETTWGRVKSIYHD